jgi:prepilin-type N-terminal cleavage/methylation domain-containing protein
VFVESFPFLQKNRRTKNNCGFTFYEVLLVLMILGIMTTIALTAVPSINTTRMRAELDMVKNHLRYAQACAMSSEKQWGIKFDDDRTYWLFEELVANRQILPAENSDLVTLNSLRIGNTPQIITFDQFGVHSTIPVTIQTSESVENITITGNTGYIP